MWVKTSLHDFYIFFEQRSTSTFIVSAGLLKITIGIHFPDIVSDLTGFLRVENNLFVINADIVQVLENQCVPDQGQGQDAGEEEAHFFKFRRHEKGVGIFQVEEKLNGGHIFQAELTQGSPDFMNDVVSIAEHMNFRTIFRQEDIGPDLRFRGEALPKIIIGDTKAMVLCAEVLIQAFDDGTVPCRGVEDQDRGGGEVLEAQGNTDPLVLSINALEDPGFGAGSKEKTAIANVELGHSPLGKFMVGYRVDIEAIEGFLLGASEQKVGDPLHAALAAVFLVHEDKGEFRDSHFLGWIN